MVYFYLLKMDRICISINVQQMTVIWRIITVIKYTGNNIDTKVCFYFFIYLIYHVLLMKAAVNISLSVRQVVVFQNGQAVYLRLQSVNCKHQTYWSVHGVSIHVFFCDMSVIKSFSWYSIYPFNIEGGRKYPRLCNKLLTKVDILCYCLLHFHKFTDKLNKNSLYYFDLWQNCNLILTIY